MGRPDHQLWDAILAHLRRYHPAMSRHWFDEIEPVEIDSGTLRLLVREPVRLRYLQRCCVEQFKDAAQAATGHLLHVRFIGETELADERRGGTATPNGAAAAAAPQLIAEEHMLLCPDYCFDNFVVGPGNRLAYAAAQAVSQKPGQAYNPLVVHGGVGLGKTHLLQAICQAAMRANPSLRVYYTSCDGFMTQFYEAVKANQTAEFRQYFRRIDLLIIDDINDLSRRETSQEEFFHTFNSLYQAGRQMVFSSDAPPHLIPELEERLTSRFNCGLVAEMERPSYETRMAIVSRKASLRGIDLPDDVAGYIASRIESNIRELEGAIVKLQGMSLINSSAIDLELAKLAIGGHLNGSNGNGAHPTIQMIIDAVIMYYDVGLGDLLSKRRHKSIALPRQVAMYLARRHTRYSLEEIGGYFGGRDHTTVMHAVRSIDKRRGNDGALDQDVTRLEERVSGRPAE